MFSKGENTNKTLTFLCYNRGIKAKMRPCEDSVKILFVLNLKYICFTREFCLCGKIQ